MMKEVVMFRRALISLFLAMPTCVSAADPNDDAEAQGQKASTLQTVPACGVCTQNGRLYFLYSSL